MEQVNKKKVNEEIFVLFSKPNGYKNTNACTVNLK